MRINQLFVILFIAIIASLYVTSPLLAEPPIQVFHFNERLDKLKKDSYIACNDKRVTVVVRTYKQPKEAQVKLCFNKVKEIMLFSGVNAQKADSSVGFRHVIALLAEQGKVINNDIMEYRVTLPIDPNQFDALKVANWAQKGKTMQCNLVAQLWVKNKKKKEDKLTFNVTSSNDPNHIYVNYKRLDYREFRILPTDTNTKQLEYHIEFANESHQRFVTPDSVYVEFIAPSVTDTFLVKQHYLNVFFKDPKQYFSTQKKGDTILFKFNHLDKTIFQNEKEPIFKGGLRFSIYPQKRKNIPSVLKYRGNVYFFIDSGFVDTVHRHYNNVLHAIAEPFSKLRNVYLHHGKTIGLSLVTNFDAKFRYGSGDIPRFRISFPSSKPNYLYVAPEVTLGKSHYWDIKETSAQPNEQYITNFLVDIGGLVNYNHRQFLACGIGLVANVPLNKNTFKATFMDLLQTNFCFDVNVKFWHTIQFGGRYYLPANFNAFNASFSNHGNYFQIYAGFLFNWRKRFYRVTER